MIEGTVETLVDHGTIVVVWLREEGGALRPVHFDHRMFRHFIEDLGDPVGLVLRFDPETASVEVLS